MGEKEMEREREGEWKGGREGGREGRRETERVLTCRSCMYGVYSCTCIIAKCCVACKLGFGGTYNYV